MATREQSVPKVTYAAIPADQVELLNEHYDAALYEVRTWFGRSHPMVVNGEEMYSNDGEFEVRAPSNRDLLLGTFQKGNSEHVQRAILAAREAYTIWGHTPYRERVTVLHRAAAKFQNNKFRIAALLSVEAGKNRMEALGEVEEAADLITTYCNQIEENNGFVRPEGVIIPGEQNVSILKPYGVWAVVAPFNFPIALATGMVAGALTAGNTVVFKPASATPFSGYELYRMFEEAGLPKGVLNYITGQGAAVGDELSASPLVDGIVFTGSREVGHTIYQNFSREFTRPCITELGGKNPAIVTARADLDKAAEGVMKSAFGYSGQKCSACSRVYVEQSVYTPFIQRLVERTRAAKVGDPVARDTFMGPVIDQRAVDRYVHACEEVRRDGGQLLTGGNKLSGGEFDKGNFVEPAIAAGLPASHRIFHEELFVPLVAVAAVGSLDEALELANDTQYGLCAGIYSENEAEIKKFFDTIQAGVTYANRRGGATTGAWPGCQSFCGWKGSGSTGKGGLGPYYVQQFMREQNQTIVRES